MTAVNMTLELLNGTWSILTMCFLVFLTVYLVQEVRIGVAVSLGVLVAISLYVQSTGSLINRMTIWAWRYFRNSALPLSDFELMFLSFGALVSSVGLLLMIWIFSRNRFGNWPWVVSGSICLVYIGLTMMFRG